MGGELLWEPLPPAAFGLRAELNISDSLLAVKEERRRWALDVGLTGVFSSDMVGKRNGASKLVMM